ncbi:carbohydrate-binding protein [Streptomyces boncukensis]|uniref:S1 family peptidase n=1 Tax=Streptomyces boncukensis TaxID=2711219 RepID=A0A6G4WZM3_9ACTN|nr:carbohydrate-binding protein [Streptomyces boncukensis]NGO70736.1 S1 family peptidase [Streptomyces boncukensis]
MVHARSAPSTPRRSRTATAAVTAALAAGALILAGFSGQAAAQPTAPDRAPVADDQLSPGLLKAMNEDLGLSRADAKARIANENDAARTAAELRTALGGSYAGAHVSGTTSDRLTVSTTDRSEVATITGAGARARVVERGLPALDGVLKKLDRAAHGTAPESVSTWYIDVKHNRVVVESARTAAARAFLDRAGVDRSEVTVRHSTAQPRPLYDVRGGDAYYMGSGGRCSVGFSVTRGQGTGGFVTAGHCGRPGTSTSGFNRQAQGSFQGSTFPGRDYAWVSVNSNWTTTPMVNGYGRGDVRVTGSTESVEGTSICRSGSTTGWHCGTVQQRNTSVSYPQGTVNGVTRTSVCAEPGDSGGAYVTGTEAQGMTSGGSGDCSRGGTTFFQPVNPALQVYGLALVTENGDDPGDPPDPPDPGTWAAGSSYQAGDTVTYDGASYRCIQSHTALPGWEPPNAPSLWERG